MHNIILVILYDFLFLEEQSIFRELLASSIRMCRTV